MNHARPFDYEAACWGADDVHPWARSIGGFRIQEALRILPSAGRVLEVGCGAGRMLRALHEACPSLSLCGADVSRRALQLARERSPGFEFRLVEGHHSPLPAADAEFDAVLLLDVLEHVEEPDTLLAESRRVLRSGGVLHAHVPCEGDATFLWRWLPERWGMRHWKRRFAGHLQRLRRRDVLRSLDAAGFDVVRTRCSLHVLGNIAGVAAFGLLARRAAQEGFRAETTTGDLLADAQAARGRTASGLLVRAVDEALWWEARLLGRAPGWGLHVSARRRADLLAPKTSSP